jgi:hypothetical protein
MAYQIVYNVRIIILFLKILIHSSCCSLSLFKYNAAAAGTYAVQIFNATALARSAMEVVVLLHARLVSPSIPARFVVDTSLVIKVL